MKIKKLLPLLVAGVFYIPQAFAGDFIADTTESPAICVAEPAFLAYVDVVSPLVEAALDTGICTGEPEFFAHAEQNSPAENESQVAMADGSLTDNELGGYRGAKGFDAGDLQVSSIFQGGNVQNNKVTGGITGNNRIGERAFEGASGLTNVIQNSGNNVLIQNSTVINLQMQ